MAQKTNEKRSSFSLRKASKFLSHIGDSLAGYGEEDRVRLLSVLSKNSCSANSLDSEDDSDTTSTEAGFENMIMDRRALLMEESSVSSDSEQDENGQDIDEDSSDQQQTATIVNNTNTTRRKTKRYLRNRMLNQQQRQLLVNKATEMCGEAAPCDPTSTKSSHFATQLADSLAKKASVAAAKTREMEWIFTLYDLDGQGTITQQDLGTLTRSIGDVLRRVKVPLNASTDSRQQPIGSFRVKLSVLAESPLISAESQQVPKTTSAECSDPTPPVRTTLNCQQEAKPSLKRNSYPPLKTGFASHVQIQANCSKSGGGEVLNQASGGGCIKWRSSCQSANQISSNKQRRPLSVNISNNNYNSYQHGQRSANAVNNRRHQQDYVNLSDLENCCAIHPHFTANLRHCKRHCSCGKSKQPDNVPQNIPSNDKWCCAKTRCTAQMAQKTASGGGIESKGNGKSCGATDKRSGENSITVNHCIQTPSPSSTAEVIAGSPYMAPRGHTHRQRQRERQRAMQLVRQWVLAGGGEQKESTNRHSYHCEKDASKLHNKMTNVVEHRHVHEHHHYVHQPHDNNNKQ